jgi:hypothetical protein
LFMGSNLPKSADGQKPGQTCTSRSPTAKRNPEQL